VYLDEPNCEVSQSIRQLAKRFTGMQADHFDGVDAELVGANGKRRNGGLFRRK
jgi:hypothetical protein